MKEAMPPLTQEQMRVSSRRNVQRKESKSLPWPVALYNRGVLDLVRNVGWSSFPVHVLPVEYHGRIDRREELIQWDCQRKEASLICKAIN